MRALSTTLFALCLAATLPAQANDFSGLRIYVSTGSPGAPTPLTCGTPFSCTPASFTAPTGATINAVTMGNLNEVFVIAASLDTTSSTCIPLGIPGLVNSLALTPGTILSLAVGVCSFSDNGRCNGGTSGGVTLFTLPAGLPPGAVLFQGITGTPLSAGGNGLAFSSPVLMNY
jgi:hypothetical protein